MGVLRASSLASRSEGRRPTFRGAAAGLLAVATLPSPNLPPTRGVRTRRGVHGRPTKRLAARTGGGGGGKRAPCLCLPTVDDEVGVTAAPEDDNDDDGYLARESGWGVRRMGRVGEEMRRVAFVQAEAFHVPVALFNDFFFDFFKAEVLSALIWRVRNSPPDRYACLVAEEADADAQTSQAPFEKIVGVVDCTVQDESDILKHIQGADEYLYVSGIAVLPSFRRRKVGTALLKACEMLAVRWRHKYMALRAYEDDGGARGLYSKAGYRVVARDPDWVTWVGRRRRVVMIKELPGA